MQRFTHFKTTLKFVLLLALTGVLTTASAQQNKALIESQARAAIQAKGLDEQEVKARLLQRGINIDEVSPEQLPQLQGAIEEVIAEMEQEKKGAPSAATVPLEGGPLPVGTEVAQMSADSAQIAGLQKDIQQMTDSLAEEMPPSEIYGHHLFKSKDLTVFKSTNEVKPPDSYVLGPGDEITISIFGASQFDSKFVIGRDGYIAPSNMPKIFLKGVALGQARNLLRSRFSNFYRFAPEQFVASLTASRSIVVNIFGEVEQVGGFNVSAINTAFNALVAAGGPTELGSVRNIQVVRGKEVKIMDLYQLINNPALQYDFSLESNDIIQVPVAERVVSIQGAVRRPFKYELTKGEQLSELLAFAGGLSANAFREVVQVKRFVDDRQVQIDVNLKKLLTERGNFELLNGDEVVVRKIPTQVENTAKIKGTVNLPGSYALTETPRVSDLLKKGGLRPESRTDVAFLLRDNANGTKQLLQLDLDQVLAQPGGAADLLLTPKDEVTVYSKARFTDKATISVTGAVRDTLNKYPYDPAASITIERAITLAGGLRADANGQGYLVRTNPNNVKEKNYQAVNLRAALADPKSADNLVLEPLDEVVALSALTYTDAVFVNVVGSVRKPGRFPYGPALTLKDVIILAGGMKLEAARNRVDIYRLALTGNEPTRTLAISVEVDDQYEIVSGGGNFSVEAFDEIVVRSVPEFELQQFVELNGEVMYPGRYALVSSQERLSEVVKRAGGLTPEADAHATTMFRTDGNKGFVVTRLHEALSAPRSAEDHILKGGDVVNVPKSQSLVTIRAVNTDLSLILRSKLAANGQISVAYAGGKRAGWYVREYAGGFSKNANRKKISVEQPNGKINRTRNFVLFKVYPKVAKGSVVYVPAKEPKASKNGGGKDKKNVDWDKKLTQIIAFTSMVTSAILAYATIRSIQ